MPSHIVLGDLLLRWEELCRQGQMVSIEELCRDCPEQREEVARQIQALQAMYRVLDTAVDTDHGGHRQVSNTTAPPLPHIPRYEILAELGHGGMGVVYKARQERPDRVVALKMILAGAHAGAEALARFRGEAEKMARLQHPHIVQVFAVDEYEGRPYFSLEYVEGGSLAAKHNGTPQPAQQAADLVETLSRAIHAAHQVGIIHRDLKPANILLTPSGTPKITDFGLAKRLDGETQQTPSGAVLGTPSYMAPEQASGKSKGIGPAADVYALGAILYEMLTGRPPFKGESLWDTVQQVLTQDPVPPRSLQPRVPRDLETICLKCLQKDAHKRYPTAAALAEDLRRFREGRPILARQVGKAEKLWRWCRRNPVVATLLGVSIVSVLSLLIGTLVYNSHLQAANALTENQRKETIANYYHSLVREARALRLARTDGYRRQAWDRLRAALELETPEKNLEQLRQEAVACMGDYVGLEPTIWNHFAATVSVIALHPPGDQLALGLSDGTIVIRDLASGADVAHLQAHSSRVHALAFGPGGRPLVSADGQGTIKVWEPASSGTWTLIRTLATTPPRNLWRSFVRHLSLAISPDGNRLASCSQGTSSVWLWNLADGSREAELNGGVASLHYIAWSPDGKLLAAGYDERGANGILVWDLATQEVRQRLSRGLDRVLAVEFSADSQLLACGCDAGIAVFDTSQFQQQGFGRGDVHCSVAFSSSAPLLAIPCWQLGQVRVWDFSANRDVAVFRHPIAPHSVLFSKESKDLISADEQAVRIWKLYTDEKLALPTRAGKFSTPAFNSSGDVVYISDKQEVIIWNPATNSVIWKGAASSKTLRATASSPDGKLLATGDIAGSVQLWDVLSGKELPGGAGRVGARDGLLCVLQFSHDGKYLAACGESGLRIFRVVPGGSASGRALVTVASPSSGTVQACCFSPTENVLAWVERGRAARGGHTVHLWDLEHARERPCRIPSLASHLRSIAFFPDGQRLVFVNETDEIEVWNMVNDQSVSSFGRGELQPGGGMGTLALSADGKWLAVGSGGGATVWNTQTQKLLLRLPQERSTIMSLAWSPNNAILLLGYLDGSRALWNIPHVRAQLAELGLDW